MAKTRAQEPEQWMARIRCPAFLVVLFTRQLSIMLKAGVPITRALETLSHQGQSPEFDRVVTSLIRKISDGHTFSSALAKFPRVFRPVYTSMAQVGERTGQLDDSLNRLADWQERDYRLSQRVRGALTYPAFVLSMSGGLTLALFYTVLPGFISIFEEMHISLPVATQLMIALANAVRNPGAWLIALGILGGAASWFWEYYKTPAGAQRIFSLLWLVPVLGPTLRMASTARYASAVATMLENGLDLTKSLQLGADASGSPILAGHAIVLTNAVMEGGILSKEMAAYPEIYITTLTHMVLAGEEASNLSDMYRRTAAFCDEEVNLKLESLTALLEPLLLVSVASVVGFVVISIMLPLYSYLGKLSV